MSSELVAVGDGDGGRRSAVQCARALDGERGAKKPMEEVEGSSFTQCWRRDWRAARWGVREDEDVSSVMVYSGVDVLPIMERFVWMCWLRLIDAEYESL